MAKVTMEFDSYEEREEMTRAMKATAAYGAMYGFSVELRNSLKYSEDEEEIKWAKHWNKKFWEILEERGIDLDNEYT